jgi:hypothetical protein
LEPMRGRGAVGRVGSVKSAGPISPRGRPCSTDKGSHAPSRGSNRLPGHDPETLLTEHVPSEMLADEHDADQLVEHLGRPS